MTKIPYLQKDRLQFINQTLEGKIKILPYQFQSLWVFEIVNKFPFLYKKNLRKKELILECVEKSILENFFLHFAGGWGESDMCKIT